MYKANGEMKYEYKCTPTDGGYDKGSCPAYSAQNEAMFVRSCKRVLKTRRVRPTR